MTTESLAPTVADVVDACVPLAPGHPVHAVRHARAKVVAATQASHDGLQERISDAIRDVTKLRGSVELLAPGSLPNDGRVIEDARSYR